MYGIAGYALPFLEVRNIDRRPSSAPKIMNIAGASPYVLKNTPAVMIGKMTSPPPRIASCTLNFLFLIDLGIFLSLYFSFNFLTWFLTFCEAWGIMKPPKILISSIWNFAIFCMMPLRQTAHAS